MKYQVVLERIVTYVTHVEVEADDFEMAKQASLRQADSLPWKEEKSKTGWRHVAQKAE